MVLDEIGGIKTNANANANTNTNARHRVKEYELVANQTESQIQIDEMSECS